MEVFIVLYRLKSDPIRTFRKITVYGATSTMAHSTFIGEMGKADLENNSFYLLAEKSVFDTLIILDKSVTIIEQKVLHGQF